MSKYEQRLKRWNESKNHARNIFFDKSAIISRTDDDLHRRETPDGSDVKVLQLRIQVNSDSPVYEDWYNDTYVEQIASGAYDETLSAVNKGDAIVYSFADHKIETGSVISSTNRQGCKLYKDESGNYVMDIPLDTNNDLHKKMIELVEQGELKANSFIFLPEEIEIQEGGRTDVDYVVIQKKGTLLSIDPVIMAFYPQNNIELKGALMNEAEKRAAQAAKEAKDAEIKAAEEAEAKADAEAQAAKDAEIKAAEEAEAKRVAEETAAKEAEEKRLAEEAEAKADAEAQAALEKELNEQPKFKALSQAEQRSYLQTGKPAKEIIAEIEKAEGELTPEARAIKEKLFKGKTNMKKEQKEVINSYVSRGLVGSSAAEIAEFKDALATRNDEVIKKFNITEDELKIFAKRASDLTGASSTTGALIIPVSTDPVVVGQPVISTPEFDGAIRMSMSGLEEKKVPVDVDTQSVAAAVAEGEDAPEHGGTVVKVQFAPTRYPLHFKYNPLLTEHANVVTQKTTNLQNSIKKAWIKAYYDGLVANAGSAFAAATYDGGATKESNIETLEAGKVSYLDLDAMILDIEASYGDVTEGEFKIEMKPETWTAIKKSAADANNSSMVRVVNGKTYYGSVQVVVRHQYPDAVAPGKFPVTLSKKSNTKIYGGLILVEESVEEKFLAEMTTRLVTGRGEAKLCDPFYTTRTLVVKA